MNKRGMITDIALYMIMMFFIAISLLVVYIVYDNISDAFVSSGQIPTDITDTFTEGADKFPQTWDYVFLTVFIGVVLGILIISYLLATQPVYFFIYMLVVVVFGALAGYLSNAFYEITLDPTLNASALGFPILSFIMSNYLMAIVIVVMLMLVVFYAKSTDGGYQ